MGYFTEYNPELRKRYPSLSRMRRKWPQTMLLLLAVVLTCAVFDHYKLLWYLFPGNPELTAEAVSVMVDCVERGEPIREALLNFCAVIIGNAT